MNWNGREHSLAHSAKIKQRLLKQKKMSPGCLSVYKKKLRHGRPRLFRGTNVPQGGNEHKLKKCPRNRKGVARWTDALGVDKNICVARTRLGMRPPPSSHHAATSTALPQLTRFAHLSQSVQMFRPGTILAWISGAGELRETFFRISSAQKDHTTHPPPPDVHARMATNRKENKSGTSVRFS